MLSLVMSNLLPDASDVGIFQRYDLSLSPDTLQETFAVSAIYVCRTFVWGQYPPFEHISLTPPSKESSEDDTIKTIGCISSLL